MEFTDAELEVLRCWMQAELRERGSGALGIRGIDDEISARVARRLSAGQEDEAETEKLIQQQLAGS